MIDTTGAAPRFDALLEELCSSAGLYSRSTFQSLTTALLRLLRSQALQGAIITRMANAEDQQRFSVLLDGLSSRWQWLALDTVDLPASSILSPQLNFMLVLGDRLSAVVYWSGQTEAMFRSLQGGWCFHPGDVRQLAGKLDAWLAYEPLSALMETIPTDRRFDENLTQLISTLLNQLEGRHRDLSLALERENKLTQQMVQSERLAAIGQLCSVIAHEIRNPLGLIGLYAKLAEGKIGKLGINDPDLTNHLQQITDAAESLEGILGELTQYSRPMTLQQEEVDLIALTASICDFLTPGFDEKGVRLCYKGSNVLDEAGDILPDARVTLDKNRYRQALLNLLKNALEATEPGKAVTVSVNSRRNDDQIFIRVEDQGCGITEAHQAKLFTPYFSTKNTGTGLGLAQVRKIMQAHGGNAVLLASSPEKGSSFALVLPRKPLAG